jgi:AcrR family transcriptional regulator
MIWSVPKPPRIRPPDPCADPLARSLVETIVERGYASASIDEVLRRAGVDRAEFEARFRGKEDCVQKVFEAFIADFMWKLQSAFDSQSDWRSRVRCAAYASAEWVQVHPRTTHFGVVDVLGAENEMIRVRREEFLEYCASLIDALRAAAPDPDDIPASASLLAIGSIAQMLTQRLGRAEDLELDRMVPAMMYQATRRYLGEEIAREELAIPAPAVPDRGRR